MAASAALTGAAIILLVAGVTAIASALSELVRWLGHAGDLFWQLGRAAGAAADAIRRVENAIRNTPGLRGVASALLPGFQEGGTVRGPIGAPLLAMVHGGETILPVGRGGVAGGVTNHYTINVTAAAASPADVGQAVVRAIQEYERRGSAAWRGGLGV